MPKRFIFADEETPAKSDRAGYIDGFRFGFGQFVAWLLGLVLVGVVAAILTRLLHWHY